MLLSSRFPHISYRRPARFFAPLRAQHRIHTSRSSWGPESKVAREDVYTIPNFLTLSRLIAAPCVGYLFLHDSHELAVGLLAYAAVTDLLDGWIARRWHRKTVVGTIIDPMADKVLMTVLTACLAIKGALPSTYFQMHIYH